MVSGSACLRIFVSFRVAGAVVTRGGEQPAPARLEFPEAMKFKKMIRFC